MKQADIGLIGLAVMGENLVLNMVAHGFTVAVYNRTTAKVDTFVQGRGKDKAILGARTLQELVAQLKQPRKVMMMVQAGHAVDAVIAELAPLLTAGDLIIDGGNSYYADTIRRTGEMTAKGLLYVGAGVSGGEEGALYGPSIMPGGNQLAWPLVKDIFQTIAARTDDGDPCCEWMGDDGAGHYVKMIHNGIEYGDMQMICEAYALLRGALGMSPAEMSEVFKGWNQGELNSYLIDITGHILASVDPASGHPTIDLILDTAGQKGTGKWTGIEALQLGAPTTTIAEAVFARCLSALKEERVAAASLLKGPQLTFDGNRQTFIEDVRRALYASKICSYAQGFQLLRMAATEHQWELDYGTIALLWSSGCIIRAQFLGRIKEAFAENPALANLLVAPYFRQAIDASHHAWRKVVATAVVLGIPTPAFSSALAYYDGYRSERLPANLLQAQRDYFGAHTYERVDRPRGEFFHTNWTGRGGATSSTTYNA